MRRAGLKRREGFNIVQAKGCSQDSGMDFHLVVVCVVQQDDNNKQSRSRIMTWSEAFTIVK